MADKHAEEVYCRVNFLQAEQARTFIEERFTSVLDKSKVRQLSRIFCDQMQLHFIGSAHAQTELLSLNAVRWCRSHATEHPASCQ